MSGTVERELNTTGTNKRSHRARHSRRKASAETKTPAALPREILDRIDRVRDYHWASKHTYQSVRGNPHKPDPVNQPSPFRLFPDHPKVDLPTDRLDADAPALAVLAEGLGGFAPELLHPPQDLRTLASWLHLANGITGERQAGEVTYHLRTCPSSSALFPFELYMAAFGIDGLEPGLYHYSVREDALRLLRDARATLARLKRGRPDLEFLKGVPAAILVSTIFCRCAWRYRQRGYRYALVDAGHLVQNVVAAANGLGIQTTRRLRLNDRTTRELIGVEPNAPFGEAEAVHAMVVWADTAKHPLAPTPDGQRLSPLGATLPTIPRLPLAGESVPYGSILAAHEDCVAPGRGRPGHPPAVDRAEPAQPGPPARGPAHPARARRRAAAARRDAQPALLAVELQAYACAPLPSNNRMGLRGLEPRTSCASSRRSGRLSYRPRSGLTRLSIPDVKKGFLFSQEGLPAPRLGVLTVEAHDRIEFASPGGLRTDRPG